MIAAIARFDRRRWGTAVTVAMALAVSAPLIGPAGYDDFPVSSYPMFSRELRRTVDLAHVVGRTGTGEERVLPPELLGTDEVIQAYETVRTAVAGGAAMLDELCTSVAEHAEAELVEILVVTDTFDVVDYFGDGRSPIARVEHVRCATPSQGEVA
ncbi:MAG: hypothetical protein KDB21_20810 [Acidimicrobiales bacterium]|nr:hypothetical protein [Acidimicrobiales bacterium]